MSEPSDIEREYQDSDEDDAGLEWSLVPKEVAKYEDSLPDPWDDENALSDQYDQQWYRLGSWDEPEDDAPLWEVAVNDPCAGCGERDDVDPLGTCSGCRVADGRCSWCGLDPVVYSQDSACRTCYQRLRRDHVTAGLELRLSMLEAAFHRADLRKRRGSTGPMA